MTPKTLEPFVRSIAWGQFGWDEGSTWDTSDANAVVHHQRGQRGLPSSGVSTTPHFERARFYATHGGTTRGYVYELDLEILMDLGARCYPVAHYATPPSVPEDDEHIIVMDPPGPLPEAAVVRVVPVE